MKKIFLMLAATATLAASMTSCSDFDGLLDEKNYGNPTIEEMMTNPENVVLVVGQCYADLKWVHDHWGYWGVNTLTADEGLCPIRMPGTHWNDGGYWNSLNTHSWDYKGSALKNIWDVTIAAAVRCNQVIDTMNDYKASMKEEDYHAFVAELEVLRSYYYYLLFDCFGRIPYTESYEEEDPKPLTEPWEVWSYLVECLERNAPHMGVVKSDADRAQYYGRVTQGFAYGLLARLYLNAESYAATGQSGTFATKVFADDKVFIRSESERKDDKDTRRVIPQRWQNNQGDFYTCCVECCDEVIKSGAYSIEDNYFNNFLIENSNSKENMFVIVENGLTGDHESSWGSMSNCLRIVSLSLHYCHQGLYDLVEKPWNGFCARPEFMELYSDTDVRGAGNEGKGTSNTKQWGWFVGPVYDKEGNIALDDNKEEAIVVPTLTPRNGDKGEVITNPLLGCGWGDGARMYKYEIDKSSTYKYSENDFVLMRYADILWMKEEALLRGGKGASSQGTGNFNTLLNRSFAYDENPQAAREAAYGATIDLDYILDERGREFAWELVRRRDLIRFGEFGKIQYVTKNAEHLKWFPIPQSVLLKAPIVDGVAVWTQNEGY